MAAVLVLTPRLLVETGFVAAELPALRRLEVDETFFLETRLFPLRGFSLSVTVSTNVATALDAISFATAMFTLAASVNASGTDVISPFFSLPIVTSLPASGARHTSVDQEMEMSLSQTNQAPPIRFEGTSKKKLKPAVVVGWKRAGALEVPLIGNVEQLSAGLAVHGIDLVALEPAVGTGEADLMHPE